MKTTRTPIAHAALASAALAVLAALAFLPPAPAQDAPPAATPPAGEFLSRSATGADRFTAAHPTCDGRGVLIAVLDTGIDVGAPGLSVTSDGKPKILDVQDFSGEGDVALEKAEIKIEAGEHRLVHGSTRHYLKNADKLPAKAKGSEYWIGFLDEARFARTGVRDVNGNGREDDSFGMIAFPLEGSDAWAAVVDTNLDGDLANERVLRDFKVARDTFTFLTGKADPSLPVLTCALNVRPGEHRISLYFDDGGHGTHVAGIAAGHALAGAPGFDGIAPGAQLIGLKIGHNAKGSISTTGAMRRAFEYGAAAAAERGLPLVFNLSYGIGSEIEGRADIDRFLDEFLAGHEDLVACISAGNNGPGVSSVETPGAARLALTAGALLDRGTARALFGSDPGENRVHVFSSRGGELAKPDVVTPGSASSSTPPWANWDVASGTSMASPQLAGCVALLLGAARAEKLPGVVGHRLVKRALRATARPLAGYAPVDQGAGVVDLPAAYTTLKRLAERASGASAATPAAGAPATGPPGGADPCIDWTVETVSPAFPDRKGPAAYWRTGTFPTPTQPQRFTVKPVFARGAPAEARRGFYRAFELRASQPWVVLDKDATYVRGEGEAEVRVGFDPELSKRPGLHSARVFGVRPAPGRGTGMAAAPEDEEFDFWCTVIVPWVLTAEDGFRHDVHGQALAIGQIDRSFVAVPAGASALEVAVRIPDRAYGRVRALVYDPEGRGAGSAAADSEKERLGRHVVVGARLRPGIWEVDVTADFHARSESTYDLALACTGLRVETPAGERPVLHFNAGGRPHGELVATDLFPVVFEGRASGDASTLRRTQRLEVRDDDTVKVPVTVADETESLRFELEWTAEDYDKFTDIEVALVDRGGKVLAAASANSRFLGLDWKNPDEAAKELMLRVEGGLAAVEKRGVWSARLVEKRRLRERVGVRVTARGEEKLTLYPWTAEVLRYELDRAPGLVPTGFVRWVRLEFKDEAGVMRAAPEFALPGAEKK